MKLLLSTNNNHKLFEFIHKFMAFKLDVELIKLSDISSEKIEIEETLDTLEGNAKLKSRSIFDKFSITTIADDTGLEVFELNNEPGVHSARYAGKHGNDQANRTKLLANLGDSTDRKARFRTVICLSDTNGDYFVEGICNGKISFEEKGANGFGYDSIFIPDGYETTFAELDIDVKNIISHRAKAIENLIHFLQNDYK